MPEPRSILITGASSGIGAALARGYAAPGVVLFLGGRDAARLSMVADACRRLGATVHPATVDVTDAQAMAAWVRDAESVAALDLVVANAGISAGSGGGGETAEQVRRIFAVNVDGVCNTVLPALPAMRARRAGQVAVMSSVAGFLPLPSAPAYSASKAAVLTWGKALRGALAAENVRVSAVCPGFVATPMTAVNAFPMPFLMPPERAAAIIRADLARNRACIAFPWQTALLVRLTANLPDAVASRLLGLLPAKTPMTNVG